MATIRQYARRLRNGRAGHRFLDLYEFRKEDPPATAVRVGLWLVALLLIGGGLAIGWLPGPGGFVAIFGLAIVGMEFRVVAVALDRAERFSRDAWRRLRGKRRE
ncbi:MAG: hypothetical protein AB7U83_07430 [Vicinamibacterales bacterium]